MLKLSTGASIKPLVMILENKGPSASEYGGNYFKVAYLIISVIVS